jgi:KAP family P-loop domain
MDAVHGNHASSRGGDSPNGDGDSRQLRLLSDEPVALAGESDIMRLDEVASALELLITDAATPPFTIAINAPWGAGKTSLARLLQARLENGTLREPPHLVCWFDAWSHSDAPDVTAALAAAVARTAHRGQSPGTRLLHLLPTGLCDPRHRRWRVRLLALAAVALIAALVWAALRSGGKQSDWNVAGALVAGTALLKVVTDGFSPFWAALSGYVRNAEKAAATGAVSQVKEVLAKLSRRATRRLWWEKDRRLIIVVDDLDRCPRSVSLDICTATSQLLALTNVVVVLLADLDMIATAAAERFDPKVDDPEGMVGRRYLEKIVQFQIDVPQPTPEMLSDLMASEQLAAPTEPKTETSPSERRAGAFQPYRMAASLGWWGPLFLAFPAPAFLGPLYSWKGPWAGAATVPLTLLGFLASFAIFGSLILLVKRRSAQFNDAVRDDISRELADGQRDPSKIAASVHARLPRPAQQLWERSTIEDMAASAIAREVVESILGPNGTSPAEASPYADIARSLDSVLSVNPRQRKRIANKIVLYYLIADRRQMLRGVGSVTIPQVAKWAVLDAQWPAVHRQVLSNPAALAETERLALSEPDRPSGDGLLAFLRTEPALGTCVKSLVHMTALNDTIERPRA